jgi:hypothetical protein
MYNNIAIGIYNTSVENDEEYEFIFNSSFYTCIDIKKNITSDQHDLYNMNNIKTTDIEYEDTPYKIQLNINKYVGLNIKFLKNMNECVYNIRLLKGKDKSGCNYIFKGIEYNNNHYYITKKYKTVKISDVNKSIIGETVIKSFCYYFTNNCIFNPDINNYYLLNSYDYNYKKNTPFNLDLKFNYIHLFKSLLLKIKIESNNKSINDVNKDNEEDKDNDNNSNNISYTFLPVNKNSASNLYYMYQYVFIMLDNKNNINKTFTNPKNQDYFGKDYNIVPTNYMLKVRLFGSKFLNYNTLYYRKTTQRNNYPINIIVKNDYIIGFEYSNIKYFIWKDNGNLFSYEKYDKNKDYSTFALHTCKDALIFLFKIC